MKSLTILAFLSTLAFLQAFGSPLENDKILDCITNPCLTVPGVGKLKGTKKVRIFKLYNLFVIRMFGRG
jgi:hypothetical protein